MNQIDTSIVLATCSRACMLRGALSSLLVEAESLGKPVEIVVVDDGSTDDTVDVLTEFQRTSAVPFIVLSGSKQGVAAARNLAAANAHGTWLASFDDDQVAQPGWLRALRATADTSGAEFIGGSLELSLPSGRNVAEFGPRARTILGENLSPAAPPAYRPASNNVLIRCDVFTTLGGYDRTFTEGAEDVELFDRAVAAGYHLVFEPRASAVHVTPETRLQEGNMRWTSVRIGASDARRYSRRSKASLLKLAIARAVVTLVRDIPRLATSVIADDRKLRLDVLCSLWYTQGLIRAAPSFLFRQEQKSAFLRSMDFRARNGERRDFTAPIK